MGYKIIMMGTKDRHFKQHGKISLETLVPEDHFYRQLETKLNLSFVRDLVEPTYCPDNGRPSVDPIVFFKLQLVMFFEDFRSERQLLQQVSMNLALRWYIGYDLDEAIPSTSTMSRLRERYGVKIFVQFFEKIVHLCWQMGLIWGKEQHIDTTFVKANVDYDRHIPRFYWDEVNHHLQNRFQPDETILQQLIRKRQVWIEPKFGELKQWHSGRQFRLRTILKVNLEALIRAAGQNIKQLLKGHPQQKPYPILPLTAQILLGSTFCNTLSRYEVCNQSV